MSDVGGFVRSLFGVTSCIDHTETSQEDIEARGMTTIAHDGTSELKAYGYLDERCMVRDRFE